MILSLCHLGYHAKSVKTVYLIPESDSEGEQLTNEVDYYIRENCFRLEREKNGEMPDIGNTRFPSPYNLTQTKLTRPVKAIYKGQLKKCESTWGRVWKSDFSEFKQEGVYQIETDCSISVPFTIRSDIFNRLPFCFLNYLYAQRSGYAIPGLHPGSHSDDGILDTGEPWPAMGGWNDAGDFRKWIFFNLCYLLPLHEILDKGDPYFKEKVLKEIDWGNAYFHAMIRESGHVFEDVAGGASPDKDMFTYEKDWWFENHPGCYGDASDNRWTDNKLFSGDERLIRTTFNPLVHYQFAAYQVMISRHLQTNPKNRCLLLAQRAWKYVEAKNQEKKTLFISMRLLAACQLYQTGLGLVCVKDIVTMAKELLARQYLPPTGKIKGFFLEEDGTTPYRSIPFSAEPVLALFSVLELTHSDFQASKKDLEQAIKNYLEFYIIKDSLSNPFGIGPYGVYKNKNSSEQQLFRDAGNGLGIRSFMPPVNSQMLIHGTSSVIASHAHILGKAADYFQQADFALAGEKMLQWLLGANPNNRSLHSGIGYRQPIFYSYRVTQIPDAMCTGYIGKLDDTPYLEESCGTEWNTQEVWSMPQIHAVCAGIYLNKYYEQS